VNPALFDSYVFVDWSASSGPSPATPSADAIWIAEWSDGRARATYWRTRQSAHAHLERRLRALAAECRRALVGFDFPFGYPSGFAAAAFRQAADVPWRATWDSLTLGFSDSPANLNNRFEVASALNRSCRATGPGPFWCCPSALADRWLTVKKAGTSFPFMSDAGWMLAEYRACDLRALASGLRIHTVWQLLGSGSVGGQGIAGIPYVNRLRHADGLRSVSAVWPFETGFRLNAIKNASIVFAETWPRVVEGLVHPGARPRDRAQVLAMARWAADLDRGGELAALLGRPASLTSKKLAAVIEEEGWILGIR